MTNPAAVAPVPDVLPLGDLRQVLESLTTADLLRLKKAARLFGGLMGMDADDLVQQAVLRAWEDGRHCRRDMKVVAFLIGTMRSIASARRKSADARHIAGPIDDYPAASESLASSDDAQPMEERIIEDEFRKQRLAALFELFGADEDATLWLMARLDADSLVEAQAMTGFDATKMNTVGRRVRRTAERAFPEGRCQ